MSVCSTRHRCISSATDIAQPGQRSSLAPQASDQRYEQCSTLCSLLCSEVYTAKPNFRLCLVVATDGDICKCTLQANCDREQQMQLQANTDWSTDCKHNAGGNDLSERIRLYEVTEERIVVA